MIAAATLADPLLAAIEAAKIVDNKIMAMILAQCDYESGGFKRLEESLNYSADGLLRVFPRYFTPAMAYQYAYHPELIANRVYGNRMGNGAEPSGDGYRYRGRGYIQLTGKDNYAAATLALDYDYLSNPDALIIPDHAAKCAVWFLMDHLKSFDDYAKDGNCSMCTKLINGGLNGIEDRRALYDRYLSGLRG